MVENVETDDLSSEAVGTLLHSCSHPFAGNCASQSFGSNLLNGTNGATQESGTKDLLEVFGDPAAENVALKPQLLTVSVPVEPVRSQNSESIPTLLEQELCWSTERSKT